MYITQEKLIDLKNSKQKSKFWIHRFPLEHIKKLDKKKCLGAVKEKSRTIKNLAPNDKIIIFTTFRGKIDFFAYSVVYEIIREKKPLFDYFFSPWKLKLKGIKYFVEPLLAKDVAEKFSFVKNTEKTFKYFVSEFKEVTEDEFKFILTKVSLTKDFPAYFEEVSFSMDDFMINTIKNLYELIKSGEKHHQFEIKKFLNILKKVLNGYGISKNFDEIQEFYAKNIWKLGFKHNPSRDPDKFVCLYTRSGKERNFSYISLD
ncbi:MAG: hypothetical protein LBB45_06775 [Methanobrevibacter sp.]|nr:hypothetical protein [Candidatus Methanovirga basalitermitum]